MIYKLYKLRFKVPVHFGSGRLGKTMNTFYADTLFSAMCTEVKKIKPNGIEQLYDLTVKGKLRISDGLPYVGDVLFLPKPMTEISKGIDTDKRKQFKKLAFVPVNDMDVYLSGEYDPDPAADLLGSLGVFSEQAKVCIGEEPYNVGTFTFAEDRGLYFIVIAEDKSIIDDLDAIIENLSYVGIGGELSSGYGRFGYTSEEDVPDELLKRFQGEYSEYMSLSVCIARDEELDRVVAGASFELIRRSGYVASCEYSENSLKKKDFYAFKGGACFTTKFDGDVFDVGEGGSHPVYRYAKPMLVGVR